MDPKQNTPSKKPKSKDNKKTTILFVCILALILGCAVGAYFWNSQVKELKANVESSNQKIEELEKQIADSKSTEDFDTSTETDGTGPTNKDVDEINNTLKKLCPPPNEVKPIGLEWLQFKGSSEKDATYYNGYARVNVVCNEPGEESAGGYSAILKKQSDGSWQKILAGQDVAECSEITKLKIPNQIYSVCLSGEETIPNPN